MKIAGWSLVHVTDRVVELRKDTLEYRIMTGRPGFVLVRGEPGMDRRVLIEQAIDLAKKNDALVSGMITRQYAPNLFKLADYQGKQVQFKRVFGTNEDPGVIGARRP